MVYGAERMDREALEKIQPWLESAPVKVIALANDLGITVYEVNLKSGISGALTKDKKSPSGWSIHVARGEVKQRQRFTIAHEIGHFLLHSSLLSDGIVDDTFYRSRLSNRQEQEANSFAADLLMPWPLINRLTDEGTNTPEALAKKLNVSEVAMKIRLGLPT